MTHPLESRISAFLALDPSRFVNEQPPVKVVYLLHDAQRLVRELSGRCPSGRAALECADASVPSPPASPSDASLTQDWKPIPNISIVVEGLKELNPATGELVLANPPSGFALTTQQRPAVAGREE